MKLHHNTAARGSGKSACNQRTISGPSDALPLQALLLLVNTPRPRKSSVCRRPTASGLARVGLSANGLDFVDGPRVYYESSKDRVLREVKPAFVAPGGTTYDSVVGGPFAPR